MASEDKPQIDSEQNNGIIYPKLESEFSQESFADHRKGVKKLRQDGVVIVYYADQQHDDKNVRTTIRKLVSADNPDLYFVEGSRDVEQKLINDNRAKINKVVGLTNKTQVIGADLPDAEKKLAYPKMRELLGFEEFAKTRQDYQMAINLKEDKSNFRDAVISRSVESTINRIAGFQFMAARFDKAILDRNSVENNDKVAKFIADEIVEYIEKYGRIPVVAVEYGGGHLESAQDIDEQVSYHLMQKGYDLKSASVQINPNLDKDGPLEYSGRTISGSGFDYQITVKDAPMTNSQIGSSTSFVSPAFVLKNLDEFMSMNSLITAYNKLDNAVANVSDRDKFKDNTDIKKVDPTHSVGMYFDKAKIAELKTLAEGVFENAINGKYEEELQPQEALAILSAKFKEFSKAVPVAAKQVEKDAAQSAADQKVK